MKREKIFCLTCCDNRIVLSKIFDESKHDVFFVRNPGNIFLDNDADLFSHARAGIDVAISLNFEKFYVIGHTECRALNAALNKDYPTKSIQDFVSCKSREVDDFDMSSVSLSDFEKINAKKSTDELRKYIAKTKNIESLEFKSFVFDVSSNDLIELQ